MWNLNQDLYIPHSFPSLCLGLLCEGKKLPHQSIQSWSVRARLLLFVRICSHAAFWWLFTMLGSQSQALFMRPIKPHASRMWLAWNCLWTGLYCSPVTTTESSNTVRGWLLSTSRPVCGCDCLLQLSLSFWGIWFNVKWKNVIKCAVSDFNHGSFNEN